MFIEGFFISKKKGELYMHTSTVTYKIKTMRANHLTPVQLFHQLDGKQKFLLESSSKFIPRGKYSFLGMNPYKTITGEGEQTIVKKDDEMVEIYKQHILDFVKEQLPKINIQIPLPFYGGAVGYIGYDATVDLKAIKDRRTFTHSQLQVYRDVIAFDHINNKIYLITINTTDESKLILDERLTNLQRIIKKSEQNIEKPSTIKPIQFHPEQSKKQLLDHMATIKRLINHDKVDQVVLSQRFQGKLTDDPFNIYCALREKNPSPYMFYMEFSDHTVLGSSPESLLQTIGRRVITNPIAGTRPRGKTNHEDEILEHSLINDPKENVEHDMLVDLSKRELMQVCHPKSLTVPIYKTVEKFQSVIHLVSEIHGQLREGVSSIDALKVCTPAGTVSGFPKQTAMEIIHQLEADRRFVYGGAVGYINFNHDLNLALAIRCLIIKNETVYLQAGAGIVKDSQPETEYEEILHKTASILNIGQKIREE